MNNGIPQVSLASQRNITALAREFMVRFSRLNQAGAYFFDKWAAFHPDLASIALIKLIHLKGDALQAEVGNLPYYTAIIPVTAEFVPTLDCNSKCRGCPYDPWKERAQQEGETIRMSREDMLHAVEALKRGGLKALIFTGGGEPLCNKHTLEGMAHARKNELDVGLFTNGSLLTEETIGRLLLKIRPNFVRVSLNAGTPQTHQTHSRSETFYKTAENILALARIRHENPDRAITPVKIGNLVAPWNVDDLFSHCALLEAVLDAYPRSIADAAFRPHVNYGGRKFPQHPSAVFEKAQAIIRSTIFPFFSYLGITTYNIEARFQDINALSVRKSKVLSQVPELKEEAPEIEREPKLVLFFLNPRQEDLIFEPNLEKLIKYFVSSEDQQERFLRIWKDRRDQSVARSFILQEVPEIKDKLSLFFRNPEEAELVFGPGMEALVKSVIKDEEQQKNLLELWQEAISGRGYDYCLAHPWRVSVAPDLRVYLCAEQNGNPDFYLGDLRRQSLQQIWEGDQRRRVIYNLNHGMMQEKCPPICVLTYMNQIFEKIRLLLDEENIAKLESELALLRKGLPPHPQNWFLDPNFL